MSSIIVVIFLLINVILSCYFTLSAIGCLKKMCKTLSKEVFSLKLVIDDLEESFSHNCNRLKALEESPIYETENICTNIHKKIKTLEQITAESMNKGD